VAGYWRLAAGDIGSKDCYRNPPKPTNEFVDEMFQPCVPEKESKSSSGIDYHCELSKCTT
jgi:hypothetical protein